MKLPRGRLLRSRVETDLADAFEAVLEDRLTGYALLEPADTLLLDGDGQGAVVFADGIPTLAYADGTGGPDALAALATPGPYRVTLRAADGDALPAPEDRPDLRVSPEMPARRLAGDADLADRIRDLAPDDRIDGDDGGDALEAFLEDDERIEAIQERAREQACERAAEWNLEGLLDD